MSVSRSFVDPTDFLIKPGLSGIVGPNGCGKSNLIEALRWIMGEASPTKVRGDAMDDVIFSGTELRPARNMAEVTLALANPDRDAPAAWNDHDEIQISRRIERGSGSSYLINRQDSRARDVRNFFADIASGTASSALVNQGQISDLIRRKPANRRHVLEEAAGITGLQSRRHEAELRLQGADRNLEQLLTVIENLESQHASLKRQERQAQRYRNLGRRIRDAEMRWRLRLWRDSATILAAAHDDLGTIEDEVNEATRLVAEATRLLAEAEETMPPARRALSEADRAVHELEVARSVLEGEEKRTEGQLRETRERLQQLEGDLEKERRRESDAHQSLDALIGELEGLRIENDSDGPVIVQAEAAAEAARRRVTELETRVIERTREAASLAAGRRALVTRISDCESRILTLDEDAERNARERATLAPADEATANLERLRQAEASAGEALQHAREELTACEEAHEEARSREEGARLVVRQVNGRVERLETEQEALAAQAWSHDSGDETPVLDKLQVTEGYERALGAALGDDLDAPLGEKGEAGWKLIPPLRHAPSLPSGVEALSRHVIGPPELERRLLRTGVVDDDRGHELAPLLGPGERLVSRSGHLWRWDGYFVRGSRSGAATRLTQRARLEATRHELGVARSELEQARQAHTAAEDAEAEALRGEDLARRAAARMGDQLAQARNDRAGAEMALQALEERRGHLALAAERLASDRATLEASLAEARRELAGLPETDDYAALDDLRRELEIHRDEHLRWQRECDRLNQERRHRTLRIDTIGRERQTWEQRISEAQVQIGNLEERMASDGTALVGLESKPDRIAGQLRELTGRFEDTKGNRRAAADRLAKAENLLGERNKSLRQHERLLSEKREERARREGVLSQAQQRTADIARQIRERLDTSPEELGSAVADADSLAGADELATRYERVVRERDNMGPVNLRADIELAEIEEKIGAMTAEQEDLEKAIQRLRKGISELNREGRQRLLAAFNEIDGHFQTLHRRLFGGHARLTLVDSDDPLEAGLEIEANPSGKKLQTLSLLSGGEQAMAALALIFALFLTNPSPVCVLDEVDAPLDDANVARFCDLLDEFAVSDTTRFLIITHHRLTMARMHRLFGVTMSEPGISQLVSVDLDAAERLKDAAIEA